MSPRPNGCDPAPMVDTTPPSDPAAVTAMRERLGELTHRFLSVHPGGRLTVDLHALAVVITELTGFGQARREMDRDQAHLVALLGTHYPARVETDPWAADEEKVVVVVVELPTGGLAWHIHDDDVPLFTHVPCRDWPVATDEDITDRDTRIIAEIARRTTGHTAPGDRPEVTR